MRKKKICFENVFFVCPLTVVKVTVAIFDPSLMEFAKNY